MIERAKRWWHEWTAKAQRPLMPESGVAVRVDDHGLTIASPDGHAQRVTWDELVRLVIETNDSGPWDADVWWILETREGRSAYPQGATGEQEAMTAFKEKLPGFDWEAVIRAQGSTTNAQFVCWEKREAGQQ